MGDPTYEAFDAALEMSREGVIRACKVLQTRDFEALLAKIIAQYPETLAYLARH